MNLPKEKASPICPKRNRSTHPVGFENGFRRDWTGISESGAAHTFIFDDSYWVNHPGNLPKYRMKGRSVRGTARKMICTNKLINITIIWMKYEK